MKTFLKITFAIFLTTFSFSSFAQQKTWVGGTGNNNWSTGGNWSPSGAPGSNHNVVINLNENSTVTINLNQAAQCASLTIGGGTEATNRGILSFKILFLYLPIEVGTVKLFKKLKFLAFCFQKYRMS